MVPKDNMGTTPLHIAVEKDCLDMFNFDSKTIVKKEDIHPRVLFKIAILTIRTGYEVMESKQCLVNLLEKLYCPLPALKWKNKKRYQLNLLTANLPTTLY